MTHNPWPPDIRCRLWHAAPGVVSSHMAPTKDSRAASGENFLEGKLLIAMPGMADPHFEKSVIFMCAHSAEGAMGIMINKPVAGLSFHDLMRKLELSVTPHTPNFPIL